MAPSGGGGRGGEDKYKDAKDLLDRIGEDVYEKAHRGDANYRGDLKGDLSEATYAGINTRVTNPCQLLHEFESSVTTGKTNPCLNRSSVRFSDKHGAYCSRKGIKGNDNNYNEGACAPYRRLHLCDKNLEQIKPNQINNTHNLLGDVCLAALHEGRSLVEEHKKFKQENSDFNTDICTALARSFADIGDIVRGKDLFLGHQQKKKDLEDNLKDIFKNIYNNLMDDLRKDVTNRKTKVKEAEERYKEDKQTGDYYQLREDWWDANRSKVWYAITCNVGGGTYFRPTCLGKSSTKNNCQCAIETVPTYFDYVPQYLRWFEEWAEELCRKRKKKLENAIKNCRGKDTNGDDRYCDLNGYNCKKTARGENKFSPDSDCNKCSVACKPFVKWIDDKKQEFLKQKNKYTKEMEKALATKETSHGTINNLYVHDFYKTLQDKYGTVNDFLQLLNKETACKEQLHDDGKERSIDFKNDEETFGHTGYCQACPWCGMNCTNDGKCKKNDDSSCQKEIPKKEYNDSNTTDIKILTPDRTKSNILRKYNNLCSDSKIKNDEWKCHYEHTDQSNICVLQDGSQNTKEQKDMSYDVFFYRSIIDMLIDSIDWRTYIKRCINKDNGKTCKNKQCNDNCKCYKKWIDKKEEEFEKIKQHFRKQGDMLQDKDHETDPDTTLKFILNDSFLVDIREAYEDKQHLKKIEERLKEKMEEKYNAERPKTAIDEFFEEEEQFATECENCQDPQDTTGGRSLNRTSKEDEDFYDVFSDEDEAPPKQKDSHTNPCSGNTSNANATYPALAQTVAKTLQQEAQTQLYNGGGSSLVGDIKNATINNGGNRSDLAMGEICKIEKKHSKAATDDSKNPCHGKGEKRFNIGEKWETEPKAHITDQQLCIPPRRRHMCTSNLEKLDDNSVIKNSNVNDTFLLEVLHAAKSEAEWIKNKLKEKDAKNGLNDDQTVCRAVRRSFADMGDIIRGRDLWDKDSGSRDIEDRLKKIFSKIKEQLNGKLKGTLKGEHKYKDNAPYTKLREHWWEANRSQVWDAMKCEISNLNDPSIGSSKNDYCGYGSGTPLDDYIPQRLRWMIEWAEWFCKAQKDEYAELGEKCMDCKSGTCTNGDSVKKCKDCKTACGKYKEEIQKWQRQWQHMLIKYHELYSQAERNSAGTSFGGTDYQQMVDFLAELKEEYDKTATSGSATRVPGTALNTPYKTPEGYIHQELPYAGCVSQQNEFCYYKNGSENKEYAFKHPPHEYKEACDCDKRTAPKEVPPEKKLPDACQIVKDLFEKPDTFKEACSLKYGPGGKEKFPNWKCITPTNTSDKPGGVDGRPGEKSGSPTSSSGAICIPPRRRRLYIKKIQEWAATQLKTQVGGEGGNGSQADGSGVGEGGGTGQPTSESGVQTASQSEVPTAPQQPDPLLKAFVESAAIETFFLWHRYKKLNTKTTEDGETGALGGWESSSGGGGLFGNGPSPPGAPPPLGPIPPVLPVPPGFPPGPQIPVPRPLSNGPDGDNDSTLQFNDQLLGTGRALGALTSDSDPSNLTPDKQLEQGIIPEEFNRQMFYTLGDYRDILFSCSKDTPSSSNDIKNIVVEASGNTEEGKKDMEKIQQQLKKFFEQNGGTEATGAIPLQNNVKPSSPNAENPSSWWDENAKYIWEGMLCSLTYKENEEKAGDEKIVKNDDVKYDTLIASNGYNSVKLENSETEARSGSSQHPQSTTLKNFVKRSPFFRYLQEWGEGFCGMRKSLLKDVKDNCRNSYLAGHEYCSGDGHDCTRDGTNYNDMLVDLDCRDCYEQCRKYGKWIYTKFEEYNKQEKKYDGELEKLTKGDKSCGDYQNFYEELQRKKHTSAAEFLKALKHCKDGQNIGEKDDEEDKLNKLDFSKPLETFSRSTYCETCPSNKVNCNGGRGGGTNPCRRVNGKGKSWEDVFDTISGKGGNATKIDVQMIDRRAPFIEEYLNKSQKSQNSNNLFNTSSLFKGVRKQQWECRFNKQENMDVCKLDEFKENIDLNEYTTFKVLLIYWLEDFLYGYYILKKKNLIKKCTQNGGNTCSGDGNSKNDCACVKAWITNKKVEWTSIRNRYLKLCESEGSNTYFNVNSFLETLIHRMNLVNDKRKINTLSDFEQFVGCSCTQRSENDKNNDVIDCLLDNLNTKIKACPTLTSGSKQSCDKSPTPFDDVTDTPDTPEDTLDTKPGFCKLVGPPTPSPEVPKLEDACTIVNGILKGQDGNTAIGGCNPKDNYPEWTCEKNKFESGNEGACMPPRRQKLCLYYLKELSNGAKEEDLREAFIKTVAAETFLSWHYYKKNNVEDAKQLESGTIPPQFLRSMYYTFADYRDICLDTDICAKTASVDTTTAKEKISKVFQNSKKNVGTSITAENWWETNGPHIWRGMLCGLSHHIEKEKRKNLTESGIYQYGKLKPDLEDFASRPQFLRWFTEWGDDFCIQRKKQLDILRMACEKYDCDVTDDRKKEACQNACEVYKSWLSTRKDQYKKQSAKFKKDKKDRKFDNTSAEEDVDEATNAHEYLHEQLKKLCKNNDCACMEKTSTQEEEIELSGINDFPESMDYPPEEIGEKCKCAIPPEPMSCVERTAQQLRIIAERNIEPKLKGNGKTYNGNWTKIEQKDYMTKNGGTCKFNKTFWSSIGIMNKENESTGRDRFKIGEEWDCNEDTTYGKNKLCIPPRRKYMCLKKFEGISGENISNSNALLHKIQDVAQNEGNDIIHKLLPENPCNESVICDAMKYSFADLGDIIRGRSKINTKNDKIEEELKEIFKKIQDNNASLTNIDLTKFREKWWDANRKDIWKAMVSCAPKDAHLKKRINNPGDISKPVDSQNSDTQTQQTKKCGYNSDPPDYDYIPERYRFLQEWSEYYCKALKAKNDDMKNECQQCKPKNDKCENDKNDNNCEKCKKKCEDYSKFVSEWKSQIDEQNKLYKELYMKAKAASTNDARRDSSIKFTKKLDESCDNPHSADKYLDISTHCTDYLYPQRNSSSSNYAFSPYPKEYKDKCKCKEKTLPRESDEILNFIKENIFKSPEIRGLKTIKKAVNRIPKRIKNIRPDAHTIHELVAKSLKFSVPKFHTYPDKTGGTPATHNILNDVLPSAIPVGIALALTSIAFLFLKKKTKRPVDLFSVLEIPQNDYGMPTLKSSNRYIPYTSGKYRGKRYIYLEGDSGTDSGYTDHYSDITSSSESEYEEFDINDIYVPGSSKYKTLIEVVLEASKRDTQSGDTIPNSDNTIPNSGNTIPTSGNTIPTSGNTIPNSDIPPPINDDEWNTLKKDFISNMLQNIQPNDYTSGNIPTNTNNTTMPHHNVDEKTFIMSIHDRNLYTGEEYSYDMTTNSGNNDLYSGENNLYSGSALIGDNHVSISSKNGPISDNHHPYSGIDLINDSLSGNQHIDIYDEVLKRKENELFGTNHNPKRTSNNSVVKSTNSDPIHNQLELFHKWLDRHRDMCEKWEKHDERLVKLKEKWENETHSGNINPSDIPSSNKTLNTDVSIHIHMDNKPLDDNIYLDTYPNKYTVENINPNLVGNINPVDSNTPNPNLVENINPNLVGNINPNLVGNQNHNITLPSNPNLVGNNINPVDENPTNPNHVQIQMSVKNTQMAKEKYPISDMWDI
ncbi:erythrocyte membrane protein 1, PfEMP1, putative [Plasmodium reichenowi]|uniref:Erythrocyte membrane protein 1, PfEMP1, putative n=1 Tax=Plasmodium reichenowi TaxID=5854 RepID=A0A2P9D593_PLARE|nr:erythrocyte membrane protein 1, PfEMP1, putative [Plasmodium reichenowi]